MGWSYGNGCCYYNFNFLIMKKTGIICDNYKLEKFKEKLSKKGFVNYEVMPYDEGTTLIKVETEESEIMEIKKICQEVEMFFKSYLNN